MTTAGRNLTHIVTTARRTVCLPTAMTVAEAIAALEAMDYGFHLFREKFSRQDSFVVRGGSGTYRIIQPTPNPLAPT